MRGTASSAIVEAAEEEKEEEEEVEEEEAEEVEYSLAQFTGICISVRRKIDCDDSVTVD